ncbi:DUF5805 domain-containing protein [Natronoarchaeum rubrum]|uniref:DUF5805 domain-containing protein n=1 Tax=Natronoarchaeum rubrum TaxID=755311 RepID=UPI0021130DFA|nr:DUF5805 domain-containing protein [Natronoarchaeum rubrum]
MTTDRDADTSRTAVKTYVPAYQKRLWAEHAEELGMSQSEFVRTMVQAGRRGFSPPEESTGDAAAAPERKPAEQSADEHETAEMEPRSGDATPGVEGGETGSSEAGSSDDGGDLTDRVLEVLDRDGALSWDELVEAVTDDIERQLDEAVQELQDQNAIRYSGREGGYTVQS